MKNLILCSEFHAASDIPLDEDERISVTVQYDSFIVPVLQSSSPQKSIIQIYDGGEEAYMAFMPEKYKREGILTASVTGDDFKLELKFTAPDKKILASTTLNTRAYVEELVEIGKRNPSYYDEKVATISCLKNQFQGVITGNDRFWFRFAEGLSEAIDPVRTMIEQSSEQYKGVPFIAMDHESYKKAFFIQPTLRRQ